jgi:hypothetical protein|tara:strand:+ start:373 stop:585 length:213 start_codon:yes stop_codon:yes gene_type:complete
MADREHGRKWDGVSRVPDDTYRQNWNNIFGQKEKTESEKLQDNLEPIANNKEEELDPETQEYVESLKEKI